MEDPNQTVNTIPMYAREFVQTVHDRCNINLDFTDSSLPKLDEIAQSWQSMTKEEILRILDGMYFYLGEVIRRNLGGCWIDPKWKNPDSKDRCYLHKVGGILTVSPSKWVERRLLEGRDESFLSNYKRIKQKAKTIKRDLKQEQSSASANPRTMGLDKSTSIITLLQFLGVLIGWVLCRVATRIGGVPHGGWSYFLVKHGYTLALVPMIWASLMVYKNTANRIPQSIETAMGVFGFIAVFVIFGLFGWLAMSIIASTFPSGNW